LVYRRTSKEKGTGDDMRKSMIAQRDFEDARDLKDTRDEKHARDFGNMKNEKRARDMKDEEHARDATLRRGSTIPARAAHTFPRVSLDDSRTSDSCLPVQVAHARPCRWLTHARAGGSRTLATEIMAIIGALGVLGSSSHKGTEP
jgi:hypothetical protein